MLRQELIRDGLVLAGRSHVARVPVPQRTHVFEEVQRRKLFGGKEDWRTLTKLVLLAHVPVVIVEGLMLGVIVSYLEKVKPEMLIGSHDGKISSNGISH